MVGVLTLSLPLFSTRLTVDRFPGTDPFFPLSKYSLNEWLINSLSNEPTFNRLRSINHQISQVPFTSHVTNFWLGDFVIQYSSSPALLANQNIFSRYTHPLGVSIHTSKILAAHAASSQILPRSSMRSGRTSFFDRISPTIWRRKQHTQTFLTCVSCRTHHLTPIQR